jgi:hypothetical protein
VAADHGGVAAGHVTIGPYRTAAGQGASWCF